MDPNQQPQQSSDYLDQIAAQAQPPKRARWVSKKLVYGGGIAILLVVLASIIAVTFAGAQRGPTEQLLARLNATQPVVDEAQSTLRNSQLRSLNSNLSIYFTNTLRDSAEPFAAVGIETATLSTGVTEQEAAATTELTNRLEDARLNAIFDRTYALEMDYQLATIMTLMQEAYNTTSNESLRTFLSNAYDNLAPTQKAFADFNEAS